MVLGEPEAGHRVVSLANSLASVSHWAIRAGHRWGMVVISDGRAKLRPVEARRTVERSGGSQIRVGCACVQVYRSV